MQLTVRLPATARAARTARRAMRELAVYGELHDEVLDAVELAVTEACANVIVHAYPGRLGGLEVVGSLCEGGLAVRVIDRGVGLPSGARSVGLGLGVPLMNTLADRVDFETPDGPGTVVRMKFANPVAP